MNSFVRAGGPVDARGAPARQRCPPTQLGFRLPPPGASEKQHAPPARRGKCPARTASGSRTAVDRVPPGATGGQCMSPRGGLLSCRLGPVWGYPLAGCTLATGRKLGHSDLATAGSRQKAPRLLSFPAGSHWAGMAFLGGAGGHVQHASRGPHFRPGAPGVPSPRLGVGLSCTPMATTTSAATTISATTTTSSADAKPAEAGPTCKVPARCPFAQLTSPRVGVNRVSLQRAQFVHRSSSNA